MPEPNVGPQGSGNTDGASPSEPAKPDDIPKEELNHIASVFDGDVSRGLELLANDPRKFEKFHGAGANLTWLDAIHALRTANADSFLGGYGEYLVHAAKEASSDMKGGLVGLLLVRGILLPVGLCFLLWLVCGKVIRLNEGLLGGMIVVTIFGGLIGLGFGVFVFAQTVAERTKVNARRMHVRKLRGEVG
jgi:hypothetical protein